MPIDLSISCDDLLDIAFPVHAKITCRNRLY